MANPLKTPNVSIPILISGPTACGKSALAKRLALELNGTVINADSMQVYQELRLITARPSEEDEREVPHKLYGFIPASTAYSTGIWLRDMEKCLDEVTNGGRRPIIVGGTGLYFMALLEGLSEVPKISETIRSHWRTEGRRFGAKKLHKVLMARDPEMASNLAPTDTQRLIRALEVIDQTGNSLAYYQSHKTDPLLNFSKCYGLSIHPKRDWLYSRINQRFDQLIEKGALEEVNDLMKLGLDPELPAMRALGVPQLIRHLKGELNIEAAIFDAKQATRRYAKRQLTWQRSNNITWEQINEKQMEKNIAETVSFIKNNG